MQNQSKRVCNLKVILYKANMSVERLSILTDISVERLKRLMNEPEDPKEWEANIIAEVLCVSVSSIWPDLQ